jgi:hypothetical protein
LTHETFNRIVSRRIGLIQTVLQQKADEYASSKDRLNNFKNSPGTIRGRSPEDVLIGYLDKHLCAINDIVDDLRPHPLTDSGYCGPRVDRLPSMDEKIGDAINYLILLEGLIHERMKDWGMVTPLEKDMAKMAGIVAEACRDIRVGEPVTMKDVKFTEAMPADTFGYDPVIDAHMKKSFPENSANAMTAEEHARIQHERRFQEALANQKLYFELEAINKWHPDNVDATNRSK